MPTRERAESESIPAPAGTTCAQNSKHLIKPVAGRHVTLIRGTPRNLSRSQVTMKASSRSRFPLTPVFVLATLSTAGISAADGGGGPTRLTPTEIQWPAIGGNKAPGSSMQGAVQSLIIFGDASKTGLYSIMFKVGPNAAIPAHWHPDNRSCFVLVGVWYFGYGDKF